MYTPIQKIHTVCAIGGWVYKLYQRHSLRKPNPRKSRSSSPICIGQLPHPHHDLLTTVQNQHWTAPDGRPLSPRPFPSKSSLHAPQLRLSGTRLRSRCRSDAEKSSLRPYKKTEEHYSRFDGLCVSYNSQLNIGLLLHLVEHGRAYD